MATGPHADDNGLLHQPSQRLGEEAGGVWSGQKEEEKKICQDGFDVKRFSNGKYSGEFKDGKMHGLGRSGARMLESMM
eukprot:746719-Hanusia_phi.AAC.2